MTGHRRTGGEAEKYTNRLIRETSPYLLQHAHNPVDWYPWCDEAFERAQRENRPVFLSVGYSTCHWCHVMEKESFEDDEIARFLNDNFIAVKVDREERPDIDELYMKAAMLFTGGGGWPMTVVLTPDKQPFFAGTYFPARDGDRGAHAGLLTILKSLKTVFNESPERAVETAVAVTERLRRLAMPERPGLLPGTEAIRDGVAWTAENFDSVNGGFYSAPKFPMPSTIELLLRYYRHSRDDNTLLMAVRTLEKMASGGIYDHLGGGFHRYSTDGQWRVPHFEKMLYDNAQLVSVYLDAFQLTAREDFARIADETLAYAMREMSDPEGGFYSATDADSRRQDGDDLDEGMFYTWTFEELQACLGPERAEWAGSYFGMTDGGNFEGRNVLYTPYSADEFAASMNLSTDDFRRRLNEVRCDMYGMRTRRSAPLLDDKIIAAWNGLMISAFAKGAQIFGDVRYAARANLAADFVLRKMRRGDGLYRTFRQGTARNTGTLSDYAFVIQGLLDLFETTYDIDRLDAARALQRVVERDFAGEKEGPYHLMPNGHEPLLTRAVCAEDGAEPSGNSVTVLNLLRLASLTADFTYKQRAEQVLSAFSTHLRRGAGAAKMLCALDRFLDTTIEAVFVEKTPGAAHSFLKALHHCYLPNKSVAAACEGDDLAAKAEKIPLLRGKRVHKCDAAAFLCREGTCGLPISDERIFGQSLSNL